MGVGYILVNTTREEYIAFSHYGANTKRELTGDAVASAITSWYLLEHPGDNIAFSSDSNDDWRDWPFKSGSRKDLTRYREVTDEVVTSLIKAEILRDEGKEIFDASEPEVYVRRLRNIWYSP